jgi:hypothetical protein
MTEGEHEWTRLEWRRAPSDDSRVHSNGKMPGIDRPLGPLQDASVSLYNRHLGSLALPPRR